MAPVAALESVVKAAVGSYPGGGGGGSMSEGHGSQHSYDTPGNGGAGCLVAMGAPPVDMCRASYQGGSRGKAAQEV